MGGGPQRKQRWRPRRGWWPGRLRADGRARPTEAAARWAGCGVAAAVRSRQGRAATLTSSRRARRHPPAGPAGRDVRRRGGRRGWPGCRARGCRAGRGRGRGRAWGCRGAGCGGSGRGGGARDPGRGGPGRRSAAARGGRRPRRAAQEAAAGGRGSRGGGGGSGSGQWKAGGASLLGAVLHRVPGPAQGFRVPGRAAGPARRRVAWRPVAGGRESFLSKHPPSRSTKPRSCLSRLLILSCSESHFLCSMVPFTPQSEFPFSSVDLFTFWFLQGASLIDSTFFSADHVEICEQVPTLFYCSSILSLTSRPLGEETSFLETGLQFWQPHPQKCPSISEQLSKSSFVPWGVSPVSF